QFCVLIGSPHARPASALDHPVRTINVESLLAVPAVWPSSPLKRPRIREFCLVGKNIRLVPHDAFAILPVDFKFLRIHFLSGLVAPKRIPRPYWTPVDCACEVVSATGLSGEKAIDHHSQVFIKELREIIQSSACLFPPHDLVLQNPLQRFPPNHRAV